MVENSNQLTALQQSALITNTISSNCKTKTRRGHKQKSRFLDLALCFFCIRSNRRRKYENNFSLDEEDNVKDDLQLDGDAYDIGPFIQIRREPDGKGMLPRREMVAGQKEDCADCSIPLVSTMECKEESHHSRQFQPPHLKGNFNLLSSDGCMHSKSARPNDPNEEEYNSVVEEFVSCIPALQENENLLRNTPVKDIIAPHTHNLAEVETTFHHHCKSSEIFVKLKRYRQRKAYKQLNSLAILPV